MLPKYTPDFMTILNKSVPQVAAWLCWLLWVALVASGIIRAIRNRRLRTGKAADKEEIIKE